MFAAARTVAQKIVRNKNASAQETSELVEALPDQYTVEQLRDEFAVPGVSYSATGKLSNILILLSCFSDQSRLLREPGDEDHINGIAIWISHAILPNESDLSITEHLAKYGFKCLATLQALYPYPPKELDYSILLAAIAYSSRETWTTPDLAKSTSSLLSTHAHQTSTPEFIIVYLLQGFIRPLFSKSRPSTVTETGRKAMPSSAPHKHFDFDTEKRNKPWKYQDVYAVTVFEWTVEKASKEMVTQNWNLFIPPLLTLIDDPDTPIRSRSLNILSVFIPKFPSKLLAQTGLGPVFEDAIVPTLLFLPSVTPEAESLQLLPPAYKALEVLAAARFGDKGDTRVEKMTFFDRVLRNGIFMGYLHAQECSAIVQELLKQLSSIVTIMGIYSVKHLKDIIPIISTALTDPFATPSILRTTLNTLSIVILNTWPRMNEPVHRNVILMPLLVCWHNVVDSMDGKVEDSSSVINKPDKVKDLLGVKEDLKEVGRLFVRTMEVDVRSEFGTLFEAEPTLNELFGL